MSRLSRGARCLIFGGYVGFAFMMTHWPQLTIPLPGRPDLVAHMSLFGLWTGLCISCGWFGAPLAELNIWRSGGISLAYCGLDEYSQSIPFIRRVCALDDFGANTLGVITATSIALLACRMISRRDARP